MNPISFINSFVTGLQSTSTAVKLKVNPITLSFRNEQAGLEELFIKDYYKSNIKHLRICHFIAIFFYGLTAITEIVLFPNAIANLWVVRFGIVIPIFVVGLLFSFSDYYAKFWQTINTAYILATGGGFIMMIILGPKPGIYSYYVGIIVSLFFGYTFIRERFIYSSASACSARASLPWAWPGRFASSTLP